MKESERTNILTVKNVSYRYSPGTPYEKLALDNVCVSFEKNKITGLIGHTGSGKSTLVQMLNGLVRPDSGRIIFDGQDIWEKPKQISKIRFKVGLVMQYPEYQLFEETVKKDIAFGIRNMGITDEKEISERICRAAAIVGLHGEQLEKSPFDLSGGQKRRASIAGVMAMEPEVLVLDEPAAGLDPEGKNAIFNAINDYRKINNATVIIVSHSMEDMARWCDNIVVMANSSIVMEGERDLVFSRSAELAEIGLNIPQVTRLLLLLKKAGIDINDKLYTVDSAEAAISELFNTSKADKR